LITLNDADAVWERYPALPREYIDARVAGVILGLEQERDKWRMCSDLERLYSQACRLCNILYYRRQDYRQQGDPRFDRIYMKAAERQTRRGERLRECRDTEHESLLWAEAQSDYARSHNQ
jgi:hypothetical protein